MPRQAGLSSVDGKGFFELELDIDPVYEAGLH